MQTISYTIDAFVWIAVLCLIIIQVELNWLVIKSHVCGEIVLKTVKV